MTAVRAADLRHLEAEAIAILRETLAAFQKPVVLFSGGKDSLVLLHLAMKAFYPAPPPLPFLHIDTGWKFADLLATRNAAAKRYGVDLIVHHNDSGARQNANPFDWDASHYTRVMKTEALKQAIDAHGFDAAVGGARRDEEQTRAKERIFSVRSAGHGWNPRKQRPEFWNLFNTKLNTDQTMRVFPLSNWRELDVWRYIADQDLPISQLYFSRARPVVKRSNRWIMVDDTRMKIDRDEQVEHRHVRFRTLGCYPLTAAVESSALTVDQILYEIENNHYSERHGRLIDQSANGSMEASKREGYF